MMLQTSASRAIWHRHATRRVGGRRVAAGDRRGLRPRASLDKPEGVKKDNSGAAARLAALIAVRKTTAGLAALSVVRA